MKNQASIDDERLRSQERAQTAQALCFRRSRPRTVVDSFLASAESLFQTAVGACSDSSIGKQLRVVWNAKAKPTHIHETGCENSPWVEGLPGVLW